MSTPISTPAPAPAGRTGRPRNIRSFAERLIGTASVAALAEADLFIVSGDLVREFYGVLAQSKQPDDSKPE